jgi:hypothetical protein
MTSKTVLDLMIGFIVTLVTQLGTTGDYSAIGDIFVHTLYISQLHTH